MTSSKINHLTAMREANINVPPFSVVRWEEMYDTQQQCFRQDWDPMQLEVVAHSSSGLFAVRSAAGAEDGSTFSFAGQFETYLNVDKSHLKENIQRCCRSLSSERVRIYAQQNGIDSQHIRMDVIVQEMVQPELSGVLFTANPLGLLNESVITVGHGLGEGVVSDRVNTTTYYFHLTDKVYYYEGKENLLSDDLVRRLIRQSETIQSLFGEYLDIEFAVKNDVIYILQARNITTLIGKDPLIFDNSNIVESYPGVSLPLTISFVHSVYAGVFQGVCRRIVKNDKVMRQTAEVYHHMVGNANGRLYYQISNWYTVLKFLPMSHKIIPVWQEMLGVKTKSVPTGEAAVPFWVRVMTYVHFVSEMFRVPANMRKLNELFQTVERVFYETYSENSTVSELSAMYKTIRQQLLAVWDVTLLNDMYAFIFTGLLKSRLKKKHRSEEYINACLSGISDIESMEPVRELITLADGKEAYSPEEYAALKNDYIRQYGDRSPEELKLESRTFRSDPSLLDERIAAYRADLPHLKKMKEALCQNTADHLPKEDPLTHFLRKRAAIGIRNREISRLNRSRAYGIVRLIFLTIGKQYCQSGVLEQQRDIFYLTLEEAMDPPSDIRQRVQCRKDDYALYQTLPAYTRLIFEKQEFDKHHRSVNTYHQSQNADRLVGTPCSFGEVTAPVLVVTDVSQLDTEQVRGKILVTKMTDPGWVFLLAMAEGIISEKGSLLSHTAIISRELKVPSVVGVEGLIQTVHTGDTVHMNGSTGMIEIIHRGGA